MLEPITDWDDYNEDNIHQHYQVPKPRFKPRISAVQLLDRMFYVCRSWPLKIEGISKEPPFQSTYFSGITVNVPPKTLMAVLGSSEQTDHYKVSQEFSFISPPQDEDELFEDDWKTINLYDWKSTCLYDPEYPTPEMYWSQTEIVDLHLGHDKENVDYAKDLKLYLELNCGS